MNKTFRNGSSKLLTRFRSWVRLSVHCCVFSEVHEKWVFAFGTFSHWRIKRNVERESKHWKSHCFLFLATCRIFFSAFHGVRARGNQTSESKTFEQHSHRFNWHTCVCYMCTSLITILFSFTTSSALAFPPFSLPPASVPLRIDCNTSKIMIRYTHATYKTRQETHLTHGGLWYKYTAEEQPIEWNEWTNEIWMV